jgi:hypothetical protein
MFYKSLPNRFVTDVPINRFIARGDGKELVYPSLRDFLSSYKGVTNTNLRRESFLTTVLPFDGTFISARGDGGCCYNALLILMMLTRESYLDVDVGSFKELLRSCTLSQIEQVCGQGELYDREVARLDDPNCPDLQYLLLAASDHFGVNICAVNFNEHEGRSSVIKYMTDFDEADYVTLFLQQGHVYLFVPHREEWERGSNFDKRRDVFDAIQEISSF